MFIIPRRGLAVVTTLTTLLLTVLLTVLLTACATPVQRADASGSAGSHRGACPVGLVQACHSGALGNAETCACQSPAQVESRFDWLSR